MRGGRRFLLLIGIVFLAAVVGAVVGRMFITAHAPVETELHALLHHDLDLDEGQKAQMEAIERRFAVRRQTLELALRSDNARLASAIQAEHGYGPQVAAAVDRSHHVMGALQKETLEHIFAMRAVLRPDQARRFDEAVVKALTVKVR